MEYNGIENIYLNGTMIGFSKKEIDEKMDAILEFADIGEYVYQPVKTYSSGMFVRLAFAVAINIDPEILIVDEALSVGDVFFQAKCYHKFEEFKAMGKTIVFVSHDLGSISKYCDRVVLLNQGTKLGEGDPKKMIDTYKQVLVGQYVAPAQETERLLDDEELRSMAAKGVDASKALAAGTAQGQPGGGNAENPELLEYGSKKALITEYYVNEKADSENSDPELGVAIKRRMEELYGEIAAHPVYAEYMEAQTAVRDLMNAVNDEIQFAVSGKRSCSSGGCASCAGCGAAAGSVEKQ